MTLNVARNSIGDTGASDLADALKMNKTLTELDVGFNDTVSLRLPIPPTHLLPPSRLTCTAASWQPTHPPAFLTHPPPGRTARRVRDWALT